MLVDIYKEKNINTIKVMLNIDNELAEEIYKEAGTNIEKIYSSLKKHKSKINSTDKTYTRCLRCGRPLKSEESRRCGYGMMCKDKVSRSRKSRKVSFISGVDYGIKSSSKGISTKEHKVSL